MTTSAVKVSDALESVRAESSDLPTASKGSSHLIPVVAVAQAALQKQVDEPAPLQKRKFEEVSNVIPDNQEVPEAKQSKIEEAAHVLVFSEVKADLEKQVKAWHGRMLACFGGVLWMVHRTVLNATVTSFRKALSAAAQKEALIKILEEYEQTLISKRKLVTKESALKELNEGQAMLERYLAVLHS